MKRSTKSSTSPRPAAPETPETPPASSQPASVRGELRTIAIDQIHVARGRLRRDLGDIGQLAESIYTTGLNHPITVRETQPGQYELIAGERRLRASMSLGSTTIDAIVRSITPADDTLILELVENLARRDLTDEEEAEGFIVLVREKRFEVAEVAQRVGRSPAYISKRVRVFEDAELRRAVSAGHIAVSEAEEFLIVTDTARRHELLRRAIDEGWDRARIRAEIRQSSAPVPTPEAQSATTWAEGGMADDDDMDERIRFRSEIEDGVPSGLQDVIQRPDGLTTHIKALTRALSDASLEQRIRAVNEVLEAIRPWQLTRADDDALGELFMAVGADGVHTALASLARTLRRLARAPRERKLIIPSIAEAEAAVRARQR